MSSCGGGAELREGTFKTEIDSKPTPTAWWSRRFNTQPGDPARRGQEVFIVQCLPCHRLRGAGTGDLGPDLGQPMPVTVYFTKEGLKALIRDPAAVRSWPQMQMPGFKANMSDLDIDAVIAYLGQITGTAAH